MFVDKPNVCTNMFLQQACLSGQSALCVHTWFSVAPLDCVSELGSLCFSDLEA